MRAAFPLLAACALLAACSTGSRQVSSTPPTVSYQVSGNDVSQTAVRAQNYCAQYGRAAQYQGLQATSSGNVAVYACSGAPDNVSAMPPSSGSTVAPATGAYSGAYAAPGAPTALAPTTQCADMLHQDRPGGTDYKGPPVPGCPPVQ